VSVKNHNHATGNPRAQHQRVVTVEEVLASPMIADPLTLLQCCSIADAAAAAVIGPDRGRPGDVRVRSSVLRSGKLWDHRSSHVWGWDIVHDTALAAYEQAGIEPGDIDVLEVHDAFTIGEIITIEALGLAELGAGAKLTESGHTALGGTQPVNPSGGLLSRGHPLGATGLAQLAEIVWQLRGEAGARRPPRRPGPLERPLPGLVPAPVRRRVGIAARPPVLLRPHPFHLRDQAQRRARA